jgi:hypothetical protein
MALILRVNGIAPNSLILDHRYYLEIKVFRLTNRYRTNIDVRVRV